MVWKVMAAAAFVLPMLGGAAWAGGTDDYGCSNATLKGEYAFGVTVYTPAPPPSPPPTTVVVNGIKVFDGQGSLTQRDYRGDNLAGPDSRRRVRKPAPTRSMRTAPAAW
jgi:hypothetical protein